MSLARVVHLSRQISQLDSELTAELRAQRAAGYEIGSLMEATGWARQTVYNRLAGTPKNATSAIIETTGTSDQVNQIVARTLGFWNNATQSGRLGLEVVVAANDAATVVEALHEAGLSTEVTWRK